LLFFKTTLTVDNSAHKFVALIVFHDHLINYLIPRRLVYSIFHVCEKKLNRVNNKQIEIGKVKPLSSTKCKVISSGPERTRGSGGVAFLSKLCTCSKLNVKLNVLRVSCRSADPTLSNE
jgi:hypothetical protein